jgi:SAM-dependent methyltransferase
MAVATRRAARLVAAGARTLVDLGCGVGADLVAFARAGIAVTGIERDPVTAAVAAANIEELGLTQLATVRCADATEVDLRPFDAAFCDPARRSNGRRLFDPDAYAPPWRFLLSVAAGVPLTAVKVAPGIDHGLIPDGVEAEWVSDHYEVVEAALWFGPLAAVTHRATVLPAGFCLTGSGRRTAPVGPVREFLYDPDGAVVRAHLVAELADAIGGTLVDPTIAYLCTDQAMPTPFARGYRVTDVLPFSVKRLRALLRERGVGTVTVKKRGSAVMPEELRRQLKLSGDAAATVVLTRVAGAPTALVCQPVE